MRAELAFDEENARRVEAIYLTPDVVEQRRRVLKRLDLHPGEHLIDIGSGPGLLASAAADAVGPAGKVCGVDISESFLAMAERRCAHQRWVEFRSADATQLPYESDRFDVAASTQVYEYVPDVDRALAELHRVLRRGGRAVVLDTDWDSVVWHSDDLERMHRVLRAWDGHLIDPHLPRTLGWRLRRAGFERVSCEVVPILTTSIDPDTYSYRMIDLVTAFVAGRHGLTEREVQSWGADLRTRDGDRPYFFSLNRYLFAASKP